MMPIIRFFKILIPVLVLSSPTIILAQSRDKAEELVEKGIELYDKGDYKGSLELYKQALKADKDNLFALAEISMSYIQLGQYDEVVSIGKKAIEVHPGQKTLQNIYVSMGNAYDALKKPKKSLEIYKKGLKEFPNSNQLYYNMGVTFAGLLQFDEATESFQNAVQCNPKHASSHNALGRMLKGRRKNIPSLMAFSRFLVLEQNTKRALENLDFFNGILKGSATMTGDKQVTIEISPNLLSSGKNEPNDFSSVDLMLTMVSGLDFDDSIKNEILPVRSIRKFTMVCSSLAESKEKNKGFYWNYYAPYFIEMKEKKKIEPFVYVAMSGSGDAAVQAWLTEHKFEVESFYEWTKNFEWLPR